jgi:peptide-methionine (R)-S-oxide reductase
MASRAASKGRRSPCALQVTRHAATERPFTGKYEAHWADGSYHCICCGSKLFDSDTKFDAGCGWPSFRRPFPAPFTKWWTAATAWCAPRQCVHNAGRTWAMFLKTAPRPLGLRYCMNSASLDFEPDAS